MRERIPEISAPSAAPRRGGSLALALAGVVLLVVLATMAALIVHSQHEVRSRITTVFAARGETSAGFVATFLEQQQARETATAERLLAGRRVTPAQFGLVTEAFGSPAAVLLDDGGRVLDVVPRAPRLLGASIASRYTHLSDALAGRAAVSNVVPSAVRGAPVAAVAVPFATPYGRRVFSVAYGVSGGALGAFVAHTVAQREHNVFLIDATGRVLASSPRAATSTLAAAAPPLAAAIARAPSGTVSLDGQPTAYTVASVAGTPWRLVVAVPGSVLFASANGAAQRTPWVVFALVAVLGAALLVLLAGFLSDRARLAELSAETREAARTDPLTGLPNRRQLTDALEAATRRARRYDEPVGVLMIDLDHFKGINDGWGHEVGDHVLRVVAACMRDVFRTSDVFGRWGGDEFLAVLPHTPAHGVREAAERLCAQAAAVRLRERGPDGISLSIGCASACAGAQVLLREADKSLDQARADGRGRVAFAA